MSDDTIAQASEITEAVCQTIIGLQADPDDVVRSLAYVLVWYLRRMPADKAKDALAMCSIRGLTSSDVGYG